MSTPTSTPRHRISREETNPRSEGSSTEASSEDSSSGTGHKKSKQPPAVGQRPRPRAGTWVAATAGSGAPSSSNKVPKTEEKASEPALSPRGPLPPVPKSHGHAVPSRSGPSIFTPGTATPSTTVPSTPSPSASKPTATKTTPYVKTKVPGDQVPDDLAAALRAGYQGMKSVPDPNNPAKIIQVPVFNIPPRQIARLLVGLETNFFKNAPANEHFTKPFRDGCGIVAFQVNSSLVLDSINVIQDIMLPFMRKTFDTEESEQARLEVRERFDTFVNGPYRSMLTFEEGQGGKKDTVHDRSFRKQFDPVIQPLESYICGSERNLDSSLLPDDFKLFLKEVAISYFSWSEKQNIPPEQLTSMIKSALIGLLFIRGLLPVWNDQFETDRNDKAQSEREWSKSKGKLSTQLARFSSFLFDDFVLDIIASTPGKPIAFEKHFKPLQKASELRRKEANYLRRTEAAASTHKHGVSKRALTRGQTISDAASSSFNKRTNIGSFVQGIVSPRKKETSSTSAIPVSPRVADKAQSSEGLLLKKTGIRETNAKRKRATELGSYLKLIKLRDRDPGYMRHLNDALAKRANYEEFVNAPAAFCLDQLEKYALPLQDEDQEFPENLKQTRDFLVGVTNTEREQFKRDVEQADQERKQAERDAQQAKRQAPANAAGAKTKMAPKVAPVPVPALNLGALANSPFADDSVSTTFNLGEFAKSPFADDPSEADEVSALSRTESSDSTEIETESSEDGQVTLNQTGLEEKEKNKS